MHMTSIQMVLSSEHLINNLLITESFLMFKWTPLENYFSGGTNNYIEVNAPLKKYINITLTFANLFSFI